MESEQQGQFTLTAVALEDGSHSSATAIPAAWGDGLPQRVILGATAKISKWPAY